MNPLSIYIHIPFCIKKCLYCDFPSYVGMEEIYENYTNCLINEIKNKSYEYKDYEVKTIFFGGGTPTLIPSKLTGNIINTILSKYNVCHNAEITTEANPATFDENKLSELISMHFNRISIGVQAWQNNLLKKLGRVHSIEDFKTSYMIARNVGFKNINTDLMFSLPSQTLEQWVETLQNIISLNPEHISCYSLILEEGTPLYKQMSGIETDDEIDRQMYYTAQNMLKENGYTQYEISNFSKAGFECLHNITYWETHEYVGFGLGAHSLIDGVRFNNTYDIKKYIESKGRIKKIIENKIVLSSEEKYSEFMFMGLRMTNGISCENFKNRFNISVESIYQKNINWLLENKLIYSTEKGYALTGRGNDISNIVFEKFLL